MGRPGYARLLALENWIPPERGFYSEAERERAQLFRTDGGRIRFLGGRHLLRSALARELGCSDPADVPLEITPDGKPFCPLPESPCFNLSHTEGAVVLAMSFRGPVGVDLEDTRRALRADAIARRWFHPEEQKASDDSTPKAFFRMWTRKEAFLKATGRGLRGPLSDCNTLEIERAGSWVFSEYQPADNLQLCIVAREIIPFAWEEGKNQPCRTTDGEDLIFPGG